MIHVVLVQPEIPPNTGNIIRLCANTGAELHLIGPMGFPLDDAKMRRAGLDYHERCLAQTHPDWESFWAREQPPIEHCWALSRHAQRSAFEVEFWKPSASCPPELTAGPWLFFGSETRGLSEAQRLAFGADHLLGIPMQAGSRSLNLSNAVAVIVYEAWRQSGFQPLVSRRTGHQTMDRLLGGDPAGQEIYHS